MSKRIVLLSALAVSAFSLSSHAGNGCEISDANGYTQVTVDSVRDENTNTVTLFSYLYKVDRYGRISRRLQDRLHTASWTAPDASYATILEASETEGDGPQIQVGGSYIVKDASSSVELYSAFQGLLTDRLKHRVIGTYIPGNCTLEQALLGAYSMMNR